MPDICCHKRGYGRKKQKSSDTAEQAVGHCPTPEGSITQMWIWLSWAVQGRSPEDEGGCFSTAHNSRTTDIECIYLEAGGGGICTVAYHYSFYKNQSVYGCTKVGMSQKCVE